MGAESDPHLDPQLLPLLAAFVDMPLNAETLPGFRAAIAGMSALPDPATHPEVPIREVWVPGPAGGPEVRGLLYQPARGGSGAALLHVHGGGFVMGLPEMDAARNLMLAGQLGCTILSVDYRLAPEHPHPAALEDCHAALAWLLAQAGSIGVDSSRIGVIGESAGAGLAASLALLARDRRTARLACQALIYPMLTLPGREVAATANDTRIGRYVWPKEANLFGWRCLLGEGPPAAGLADLALDLSGLPPTFLAAAELDLFAHDNLAFASRLMLAGNAVESHCYAGAFHGFDRMAEAAVAQRFTRDLLDFLARKLGQERQQGRPGHPR